MASHCHRDSTSEELSYRGRRRLVVNDPSFFTAAHFCLELAPDAAVPRRDASRLHRPVDATVRDNQHADAHHDGVEDAWVALDREFSLLRHFAEA